jgi:mRNA-degrading endonuclease RelE of RelBE toxin-antitoxin system
MMFTRILFVTTLLAFSIGLGSRSARSAELGVLFAKDGVLFYDMSAEQMKRIAKENNLGKFEEWPRLKATGHPEYEIPESFLEKATKHPEWKLSKGQIGDFRIGFETKDHKRTVYLYRPETKVLIVLFVDIEKD